MRLGMFMMQVHPPERLLADTLAEDTEKSLLADRLGFDELWLGEHFSATSEPIPSPLMFMAGLVPRTTNLRFGTAVINLPNHDPVIVAAEAAQFDHMSRGRFMLGIGPGGLISDFELFKNPDHAARNRMVVEAMDMIERIWTQDPPYDLKGEFWNIAIKDGINAKLGVGFMPKPYQQPRPQICISLASPNSASARTAAQRAIVLLKNDGVLPLDPAARLRLAVIGPNAVEPLFGGYSSVNPRAVGILTGIQAAAGKAMTVEHADGVWITEPDPTGEHSVSAPARFAKPADNVARIAEAVKLA